jgi:hypothetical protein
LYQDEYNYWLSGGAFSVGGEEGGMHWDPDTKTLGVRATSLVMLGGQFVVKSSNTALERTEYTANNIKVFDANGNLRVFIGVGI